MDQELLAVSERIGLGISSALAAKPLLERLLGPSFDYVGRAMADLLARFGNKNLADIFRRTAARLEGEPHVTSARILKFVIESGSLADDDVTKEYFAGIFASSLAGRRDEHGVIFLHIIGGCSPDELRLHHIIYTGFYKHRYDRKFTFYGTSRPSVFVPDETLMRNGISTDTTSKFRLLAGLASQTLLGPNYDPLSHFVNPNVLTPCQ